MAASPRLRSHIGELQRAGAVGEDKETISGKKEREGGRGGSCGRGGVFVQLLTSERLTHTYKGTKHVKKICDLVQTSE